MAVAATPDDNWHDTFGRQRAWEAARNIAEREARRDADVDPATDAAFDAEVERRTVELLAVVAAHLPANPLAPYLIDWAEFWATDDDETEWLLEPLFADGRSHALYAGAKTGKSYLILAACAALATGRAFLDRHQGDPVHVLYVDYEMSAVDVRERLEEFGYGPADDLSRLHYALLPSLPPLDTDEGGTALLDAAQAVEARFVVIDTTSRAIQGDENDADTMRAFYRHSGLRLKQAGIGWMRLDHAGKDPTKGQRGTSAKNDDVDVVARIERTDGGQRWIATHRRMSWYPEVVEIAVTPGEDGVTRFSNAEAPMWPDGTGELAAELDRIGVPLSATVRQARDVLSGEGVKRRTTIVAAALKWRRSEAARKADEAAEVLSESIRSRAVSDGKHPGKHPIGRRGNQESERAETPRVSNGKQVGNHSETGVDVNGKHPVSLKGTQGVPNVAAGDPDDLF